MKQQRKVLIGGMKDVARWCDGSVLPHSELESPSIAFIGVDGLTRAYDQDIIEKMENGEFRLIPRNGVHNESTGSVDSSGNAGQG